MKIVSWNINSIHVRVNHILELIKDEDPDLILLQELKCEESKFPYLAFEDLPYNIYLNGQKSYNGVAILSKYQADEINLNFKNNPLSNEARFIEISCNTVLGFSKIICVYVPNGGEINSTKFLGKIEFFNCFYEYLLSLKQDGINIIIGGDFNIAPFDMDVYSPEIFSEQTCFSIKEKNMLRLLLNSGYIDLYRLHNSQACEFSWWDYRGQGFKKNHGIRIDFLLSNTKLGDKSLNSIILKKYRGLERPSDHAPIMSIFG